MKICLVACPAGHLTEILALSSAYERYDHFYVTHDSARTAWLKEKGRTHIVPEIGLNPLKMLVTFYLTGTILIRERPNVIISTGTQSALPFFVWAKVLRMKTIFIESWCRVYSASKTGRLIYPWTDEFFVMWPTLLKVYGSKARYDGGLL